MRLSDLQNKDVVNMLDGRNIGNKIDEVSGKIESFVIEPSKNFLSFLRRGEDTEIDWQHITKIGEDVILVNITF